MTDATSILRHKVYDIPSIRASPAFGLSAFAAFSFSQLLSCLDLPSVSPHAYRTGGYTRFRYPLSSVVVLSLPLSFSLLTTPEKSFLFSALSCIAAISSDLILVDARRAYQRCCTSAWALSSCARKCRESVEVSGFLEFRVGYSKSMASRIRLG